MKKIVGFFQVSPTMDEKKPYLAVILIQTIYSGMFLLSKAAFNGGMNNFVFVFYRQAAATLFLTPIALFFEWKNMLPLSFVTFFKIFLLSLFGITLSLDIYGIALVYTSATLAAATSNCLPVITFFLALLLGMEMLKLKTTAGIAKLIGILVCTAGAVTLALYKGPHWKLLGHPHFFGHPKIQQDHGHVPSEKMWIKGCFLMLVSNTLWGLWLVLQAQVMKSYRSKLLFTTFQCFLSSIQSFAFAIAFERDPNQWKLGWNVRLLAVSYCGIVVTGVTFYLQTWVIEKKGPVFLAMSTPLALIITMFSSAILLGEIISLGSLLGGILLVGGLYSVLWGKSREQKVDDGSSFTTEVNKEGLELKEAMASKTTPSLLV